MARSPTASLHLPELRRDVKVWLERAALVSILTEAQASVDGRETGGLLIGFEVSEGVLVTEAGGPGPNAVRRGDFFLRDLEFAECLLQDAFARTGAVWVGDWHTHPGYGDQPSPIDTRSYKTLLADAELDFEEFLALIITSESGAFCDARFAPWVASQEGIERAELVI